MGTQNGERTLAKQKGEAGRLAWDGLREGRFLVREREEGERKRRAVTQLGLADVLSEVHTSWFCFVSEMRIAGSSRGRTEGHGSQGGVKQADRMIDLNWQHRAMSEETLAGFWLAARGMALAPSEPGRREGSLWEQV